MTNQNKIYNTTNKSFSNHLLLADIESKIDRIKRSIFKSNLVNMYMKYRLSYNTNTIDDYSYFNTDDRCFCILICRFISSKESISNIALILEYFLYNHRYHIKYDNDLTYFQLTINKVITLCTKDSLIGILRMIYGVDKNYYIIY